MMPLWGRSSQLGRPLEALRAVADGAASLAVVIGKSAWHSAAVEAAERHGFLIDTATAHQSDNISRSRPSHGLRAGQPSVSQDNSGIREIVKNNPRHTSRRLPSP